MSNVMFLSRGTKVKVEHQRPLSVPEPSQVCRNQLPFQSYKRRSRFSSPPPKKKNGDHGVPSSGPAFINYANFWSECQISARFVAGWPRLGCRKTSLKIPTTTTSVSVHGWETWPTVANSPSSSSLFLFPFALSFLFFTGLELLGLNPPPVHVYRRSFLGENRFKISIPGQNFKHFDV